MIDAFWTRWRVRRLYKVDQALAGKWLDDYAGWLYRRAWYCTGQNEPEAHRILSQALSAAAGRIVDYLGLSVPMSEWLLGLYLTTEGAQKTDFGYLQDTAVQAIVRTLTTQSISDNAIARGKLLQACQCALALLGRDDQEILISRYLRMETPAQMAAAHDMDSTQMQGFLYRARHAFRRTLESLTGTVSNEMNRPAQDSMEVLEANLENLFQSLGSAPKINPDEMNTIRATVLEMLSKHKPSSTFSLFSWKSFIAASVAVTLIIAAIFWRPGTEAEATHPEPTGGAAQNTTSSANQNPTTPVDMGQEMKLAFELGENNDVQGLIGILQTGSYPAQLVAAKYLGQFADKSAINALDQAAQKWYAQETNETNPFIEAIKAIENRALVRQRLEAELEKIKTRQAVAESTEQGEEPSVAENTEPNQLETEPNTTEVVPDPTETPTSIFQQPDPVVPEDLVPVQDVPIDEPNLVTPQEEGGSAEPDVSLPVPDPNLINDELVQ
ncbi:MAG: hypothetical protein JXB18_13650 [Sedimentisphaerales bacterium]|nr:hypothetical protein [Sedimentisphaerales bacterium]